MNRRQCIAFAGASALGRVVPASAAATPDRYGPALAAFDGFNGTIVAARGAEILYGKAVGLADPATGTPMTLTTRFETGSVSKWIAAIVVMKLVDDGKLALDTPITRYLPDYRADTGARLTLRHLMSHSSGVPNEVMVARKADPRMAFAELDQMEAVRRYASGDLRFAPGSTWDYSHSNWLIVKAIVERAAAATASACPAAFANRWA